MPILSIQINEPGQSGVEPRIIRIETNDTLAQVTTAGYLNDTVKKHGAEIKDSDMALVITRANPAASKDVGWLEVSNTGGVWSLISVGEPGEVTLPTATNRLAHFSNATGTLTSASVGVDHAGDLQLGLSGTLGRLILKPATASKGSLIVYPNDNTGNDNVTISNAAHGQATVYSIPDIGAATGHLEVSPYPEVGAKMLSFDIVATAAALASNGQVTVVAGSGTVQYKIREIMLSKVGTDFSGGGGDRKITVYDTSTQYTDIPAASLTTLADGRWGDAVVPFPQLEAPSLATVAGAAITIQYAGGTADYTAGSCTVTVILERVA